MKYIINNSKLVDVKLASIQRRQRNECIASMQQVYRSTLSCMCRQMLCFISLHLCRVRSRRNNHRFERIVLRRRKDQNRELLFQSMTAIIDKHRTFIGWTRIGSIFSLSLVPLPLSFIMNLIWLFYGIESCH
jgi:hypothetical protein